MRNDTDRFWKLWSEAAADAYVEFLELEPVEVGNLKGRGTVKLIEQVPLPRGNEDKRVRNEWS